MAESPERFGADYYQRVFGLDRLERFSIHWWSVRFYARLARRLLRRDGGRRLLEIGCAHGYTLAWLQDEFACTGLDLSPYAIERARREAPRAEVFAADIGGDLPEPVAAGGFDLVLAKYVLEHLPDPGAALRRVHELLRPGGAVLFSVPDMTSPGRRFKGADWYAFKDETHVSLLDPPQWLELVARSGLVVERTFSDGLWDMPYLRRVPTLLQYGIFCLPTIATVLLARPLIPAGWGENLIVVARRPAAGGEPAR